MFSVCPHLGGGEGQSADSAGGDQPAGGGVSQLNRGGSVSWGGGVSQDRTTECISPLAFTQEDFLVCNIFNIIAVVLNLQVRTHVAGLIFE